jgi:hypothetical protein
MPNFFRGTRYAIRQGHHQFKPKDLTGLQLWLDPYEGLYQETGSPTTLAGNTEPVGSWVPRIGPTLHSLTDARRPTRQTVNGRVRVSFDGTDDFLLTDDSTFLSLFAGTDKPCTVAFGLQVGSVAVSNCPWAFASMSSPTPFMFLQTNTTPAYTRQRRNDANQNVSSNDGTPNTSYHSSIFVMDGVNINHYIDGVVIGSPLAISSGAATFTRLAIGCLSRSTGDATFYSGYIGHFCFWNRALTPCEITKLNKFLIDS